MLTYENLKNKPKELLSATGLTVEEFEYLLPAFEAAYQTKYAHQNTDGKVRQRRVGAGVKGKLQRIEDKLLFILVYQKTYPLQTMQGLHFAMSQSQANEWIHRLMPILREALDKLGMKPERDGTKLADSQCARDEAADWLIDGSERRRQRPKDKEKQQEHYSGKKKAHTDKNILVTNGQSNRVVYLGPTEPGKTHDKKMADNGQITYPKGATLGKDTGFQGYEPPGVATAQPTKKPRGQELSAENLFLNRMISGFRIEVEHVISGVKRCRIVKETFRNLKDGFSDMVMEIACGLHNLRTDLRHPVPTVNLLEMCT